MSLAGSVVVRCVWRSWWPRRCSTTSCPRCVFKRLKTLENLGQFSDVFKLLKTHFAVHRWDEAKQGVFRKIFGHRTTAVWFSLRPFLTVTHKVTFGPSLWVCEWDPPSLRGRKVRPHFVNSLFDQKFSRSSAELCESQSRVSQSWTPSLRSRYKMRSRHILTSAEYISLFIFVAHNVFQCQVILALHGGCSSEF